MKNKNIDLRHVTFALSEQKRSCFSNGKTKYSLEKEKENKDKICLLQNNKYVSKSSNKSHLTSIKFNKNIVQIKQLIKVDLTTDSLNSEQKVTHKKTSQKADSTINTFLNKNYILSPDNNRNNKSSSIISPICSTKSQSNKTSFYNSANMLSPKQKSLLFKKLPFPKVPISLRTSYKESLSLPIINKSFSTTTNSLFHSTYSSLNVTNSFNGKDNNPLSKMPSIIHICNAKLKSSSDCSLQISKQLHKIKKTKLSINKQNKMEKTKRKRKRNSKNKSSIIKKIISTYSVKDCSNMNPSSFNSKAYVIYPEGNINKAEFISNNNKNIFIQTFDLDKLNQQVSYEHRGIILQKFPFEIEVEREDTENDESNVLSLRNLKKDKLVEIGLRKQNTLDIKKIKQKQISDIIHRKLYNLRIKKLNFDKFHISYYTKQQMCK